jgi:hypothetical protein
VRAAYLAITLLTIAVAGGASAGEVLLLLKPGSWVCATPEAHDVAVAEARNGKDLEALKAQLLEKKLCMYVDDEYVEKMMVPYAQILERQGDKVRVSFTVEFRKRIEFLHRQIRRVTFGGWTDAANLVEKEIL